MAPRGGRQGVASGAARPPRQDPGGTDIATRTVAVLLLAGFQGGGAERVAAALVDAPPPGDRSILITNLPASMDRYDAGVRAPRIALDVDLDETRIRRRGMLRAIPATVTLVRRMRATLRQHDVDVVVSFLTTANLLALVATRGLGIRVVVSERNDPVREATPAPIRWSRRLLYRFADVVTANSQAALDALRHSAHPDRMWYVPNPVVVPESHAQADRSKRIVTVGRLVAHKDHELLVDAFARLAGDHPGWVVDVVGDGPQREALQARVDSLGLTDRVQFHGFAPDPSPHYREAAIYVITSRHEGMPNTLLEAMAHGLPCVVADSLPGALAVCDATCGQAFRSGDPDDLAATLQRLMEDPALRIALGAAGRERVQFQSPRHVLEQWWPLITGDVSARPR